ncbi:hypothetical protein MBLNU230_g3052t1 [Neophaeotheca triangularis]
MSSDRELPADKNPVLEEDRAPSHPILVERRCLGQTELKVKPGQIGTSNATKPDNLGTLDYAHLRVPLPPNLNGSGIFIKGPNRKYPEAYFLMRRSNDGFVSATGMFKAAFPWASAEEEGAEKAYIKALPTTSSEEVAGNVWIHPDQALELSEEYGIKLWVAALLDPEPITHGGNDPKKYIQSPPAYKLKEPASSLGRSPEKKMDGTRSTRGKRSLRSASPVKKDASQTPARKIATPRKPRRGTRAAEKASVEPEDVNGDSGDNVKVEVENTTRPSIINEEEDIEQTNVKIEMPKGLPDLEMPNDSAAMMEQARKMVREAERVNGPSSKAQGKRKAEEMVDEDDEVGLEGPRQTKKQRQLELQVRKQKIQKRALTGIAGSLFLGSIVPLVLSGWPFA